MNRKTTLAEVCRKKEIGIAVALAGIVLGILIYYCRYIGIAIIMASSFSVGKLFWEVCHLKRRHPKRRICWKKARHELYCLIPFVLGMVLQYCNANKIVPANYDTNPVSAIIAFIIAQFGWIGFAISIFAVAIFWDIRNDMSYFKKRRQ